MIPITFDRDDSNNTKKGTMRGQDLAAFLSISMSKRAGILDIFTEDSATYPCSYDPNIVYTTGYATLTMHKGYVNIFGRCIYVEEGETVQIPLPDSGTITGSFGIEINLGETGSNEVKWFTSTSTLSQNNLLNHENDGIYQFRLYDFTASSNSLTLSNRTTEMIKNIDDYMKGANFETQQTSDNSKKLATTEFSQNLVNTIRTTGRQVGTGKDSKGTLKLDNGIIMKWGYVRTPSGRTTVDVLFDTQNPFWDVYSIITTPIDADANDRWVQLKSYNNNGFRYVVYSDRTDVFYFAIGE